MLKNLRKNRADGDAAKILSSQRFDMCIMRFYQRYSVTVTKITGDKTGTEIFVTSVIGLLAFYATYQQSFFSMKLRFWLHAIVSES